MRVFMIPTLTVELQKPALAFSDFSLPATVSHD